MILYKKDEKRMREINCKLSKLRIGSRAESIRQDLSTEDGDLTFSEDPRPIIYDTGNVELFELGNATATVQCQSCFKHVPEAMIFCECGYCLRPNKDVINKINAMFKTLFAAYHLLRVKKNSRGENMESNQSEGRHEWCHKAWLFFSVGQMTQR